MKPTYKGFEAKKDKGFITLPPVGAYIAKIIDVRFHEADEQMNRDTIELMIDITEGEYENQYMKFYNDQKNKFGDSIKYKGVFRLTPPVEDDEDWRKRSFEGNMWAIQESNDGYHWDWDEKKLKGKKVGISVREYLYTYKGKEKKTTEIGRLESIKEIKDGKVKPMNARDKREKKDSDNDDSAGNDEQPSFTDVSKTVDVPW